MPKSWSKTPSPNSPSKFLIRVEWTATNGPQPNPTFCDLPWEFESEKDVHDAIEEWRKGKEK